LPGAPRQNEKNSAILIFLPHLGLAFLMIKQVYYYRYSYTVYKTAALTRPVGRRSKDTPKNIKGVKANMSFLKIKRNTIQFKLLSTLLPVFLISLIALAGISIYLFQNSVNQMTQENAEEIGGRYSDVIRMTMSSISSDLSILAVTPEIKAAQDQEQIVTVLAGAMEQTGLFDVIFFIWPEGNALRSTNTTFDASEREYFKKVMQTKQPYVSNVMISSSTGLTSVVICEPVLDGNNLVGIIGATYTLNRLDPVINQVVFEETGYGYITDSTGLVIANPTHPETINTLNLSEKTVNPAAGMGTGTLDEVMLQMFKTAQSGKNAYGAYEIFDEMKVGIFTPIELEGGQTWVVAVNAPETEVNREMNEMIRAMLITAILCSLFGVTIMTVISRRISQTIVLIRDECLVMAGGDLSAREFKVKANDETGELAAGFTSMKKNIGGLVSNVQVQAETMAAASQELTAGAQSCSENIETVSRAMKTIDTGVKQQAEATGNISNIAQDTAVVASQALDIVRGIESVSTATSQRASAGQEVSRKAVEQMNEIRDASAAVHNTINELSEGFRKITEIVNFISDVAAQTNLLALNAAIEAARAGEHGRGFAVVAEEVKKLSESSNEAAQQITELIVVNQKNMEKAVNDIQINEDGVSKGTEAVNISSQQFEDIAGDVLNLSGQINTATSAVEKIAEGNSNLVAYIEEIEAIIQDTTHEVDTANESTERQVEVIRQIAESSQNLAELAEDLRIATASFKL
jgi:methyl-accepting chemotaxis protein